MKNNSKLTRVALGVLFGIGTATGGLPFAYATASPVSIEQTQQDNVLRATLDNGLRVVIVRDTLAPVVTTQVTYGVGGYYTPEGFPGDAHALEHMMFRGSKGLSGPQLFELLGKMGASYNAFTTEDGTQYYLVAPARYLDLMLKVASIRMGGATLTQRHWSLEKGAIEQEVSRDISSPDFLAFEKAEKVLFASTGYAHDPLGTRPSFDKTTSAMLRKFYDQWYVPNNAVLVITGDVDPQATLAKVKQLFGQKVRRDLPERKLPEFRSFQSQTIAKATPDATGTVEFIYRFPGERSEDYAALQVLMDVLNNPRSHLSELAAQGKVLSANTGAQTQSWSYGGMGVVGVGFPKGGNAAAAQGHLQSTIDALLKTGVPADLVEAAKRKERANFEFNKNSSTGLAESWSQALVWQGASSPKVALDLIEKVTPADVDRVAREYLKNDQRVTVVLTPNPNGKRPPHSVGFGGTEHFAGNATLHPPLPGWATTALAKLEMPKWTLDPVSMKLGNGMTLIVQPEDVSKTVTVAGEIDHDNNLQAPKGQMGVGQLLDSLFSYGTVKLDRNAFNKALDQIAATELAGSKFSLAVPSANFDRGMQLLAANELHPALPQQAFDVQQQSLAHTLAGMIKSPRYRMQRAFQKGLVPADDPSLRQATPAKVDALTLTDVKHYYTQTYRPDMTTIVVVGDVTPAHAKAEVEKYFGDWKAVGPKPDVIPKPVPVNKASYTVVTNPYASQDEVLFGQMVNLNIHNPERYALQLGNGVLGGNGFASRLMVDIRVKHGYAYGASSFFNFGRSRSRFLVFYGSDATKVAPVDRLVQENLKAMRDAPVKPSELLNAKEAEIRSIPLEVSSIKGITNLLLGLSIKDLPLNEPMIAARHYLDITAGQLQSAFQQYVQPAHLVQVVEGPAPKRH